MVITLKSLKKSSNFTFVAHDTHDERHQGAISIPIYQNTLFSFAKSDAPGHEFKYSRMGNPTVQELEKKLAFLEAGEKAACFSSGMGAISASILSTVRSGDHIICTDQVYFGTRELLEFFLKRYNVETTYVDTTSVDNIANAIKDNTSLIYLESPTSFYFQLQDLKNCAVLARSKNIRTIIDNTWASPCFQNPIELGIDLVVHSLTKYVGGHSDVLGGVVIGPKHMVEPISRIEHQLLGATMTPHTASLLLRGLRTLPLRMERLSNSTIAIAEHLSNLRGVRRVNFPGHPSHPNYQLALSQMKGYGSLLSVEVSGTIDQAKKWVDQLEFFRIGLSFGGYESLALVIGAVEESENNTPVTLIRINVGLEDPMDLIEDLSSLELYF